MHHGAFGILFAPSRNCATLSYYCNVKPLYRIVYLLNMTSKVFRLKCVLYFTGFCILSSVIVSLVLTISFSESFAGSSFSLSRMRVNTRPSTGFVRCS